MYIIQENFKIQGDDVVSFDAKEQSFEDFSNLLIVRIKSPNGKEFDITDFDFAQPTQCFTVHNTVSFRTKIPIPEEFLQRGNELRFIAQ